MSKFYKHQRNCQRTLKYRQEEELESYKSDIQPETLKLFNYLNTGPIVGDGKISRTQAIIMFDNCKHEINKYNYQLYIKHPKLREICKIKHFYNFTILCDYIKDEQDWEFLYRQGGLIVGLHLRAPIKLLNQTIKDIVINNEYGLHPESFINAEERSSILFYYYISKLHNDTLKMLIEKCLYDSYFDHNFIKSISFITKLINNDIIKNMNLFYGYSNIYRECNKCHKKNTGIASYMIYYNAYITDTIIPLCHTCEDNLGILEWSVDELKNLISERSNTQVEILQDYIIPDLAIIINNYI